MTDLGFLADFMIPVIVGICLCAAGSDPFYLDQRMECFPCCDTERIIQRSGIHRTASAVQTVYRKERR